MSDQIQKIEIPNLKTIAKIIAINATISAHNSLTQEKDPNQEPSKIKKATTSLKNTTKKTVKATAKASSSFFSTLLDELGYEITKKS